MIKILRVAVLLMATSFLFACSEPDRLGMMESISATTISFADDVKPVLDSRCVACHACYDAPCQLKLTSYEGLARGGSRDRVYDPKKLREAPLSRLYFDAQGVLDWRSNGFHSVLSESAEPVVNAGKPAAKEQFSSLVGMLQLKKRNPLPPLAEQIDVPIDDQGSWQCASDRDEFSEYASDYPQRGMPYALPALSNAQSAILQQWIAAGAPNDIDHSLTPSEQAWVKQWEAFLNRDSNKAQLVARYIYEHLFLANLYSQQTKPGRYFQLVRSKTAPGNPLEVVATRRPYDHPGVERVYYRLRINRETIVAKTHMPYLLDQRKRQDWQQWFFDDDYSVTRLPGYDIETASNPFNTFAELPVTARYRLMLSEANFTVQGFIKGPVCKGPTAVNVINEHFWVFFLDPETQGGAEMNRYLSSVKSMLDLPAEKEDTLNLFGAWDEYADKEKLYLIERTKFIDKNLNDNGVFDLDLIWDGDGNNPNAALTIFRHYDNASVQQGLNGQPPKTAWVIGYPLLERIHYLLIAGYDVYGNISHQLLSRIYMDFLRMEGESMFLTFLDQADREKLRQHWYRDADQRLREFMSLTDVDNQRTSIVEDGEKSPKLELYGQFSEHIGAALSQHHTLSRLTDEEVKNVIERLQGTRSQGFTLLPEVSLLQLVSPGQEQYFTLLKNTGHLNNASVLFEGLQIAEQETTVSMIPGFIGPRPHALMRVERDQLQTLTQQILEMRSEDDYTRLMDNYGIRRTDPNFWAHYDQFTDGFKRSSGINFGILDLNKLENR
ncbi:MAG: peptidylprolyl isomerase [Gammaproteobacteria bacterium]|nr:peptidylprolyl isomerase [Gammaproteobacteria bacterium]